MSELEKACRRLIEATRECATPLPLTSQERQRALDKANELERMINAGGATRNAAQIDRDSRAEAYRKGYLAGVSRGINFLPEMIEELENDGT